MEQKVEQCVRPEVGGGAPALPDAPSSDCAYVYVMTSPTNLGWVKVGYTERDVEQRRRELSSAAGVRQPFEIAYVFSVPRGTGDHAELLAHRALNFFKREKEFFQCEPEQAVPIIENALRGFSALQAIDVLAAKDVIESCWQAAKQIDQKLEALRQEHHVVLVEFATRFRAAQNQLKSRITAEFDTQLRRNRIFAVCGALLTLPFVISLSPVSVSDMRVLVTGFFWVPTEVLLVSWFIPLSIEGVAEFRQQSSLISQRQRADLSALEATYRAKRALLEAERRACRVRQYAAEDKLTSFGLNPRFKQARKRR